MSGPLRGDFFFDSHCIHNNFTAGNDDEVLISLHQSGARME